MKGEPKGSARLSVKPVHSKVETKPKKAAGKAKFSGKTRANRREKGNKGQTGKSDEPEKEKLTCTKWRTENT